MLTKKTVFLTRLQEITGHAGSVYTIDGAGDKVYTGSGDHFVARWDLVAGAQDAFSIQADASVYSLKLVKRGKQLIFGLTTGALHVIDLEQKTELRHFVQHRTAIFSIAENPVLQHIYTADADGNLAIWKSDTWDLLLFLPLQTGKIRDIQIHDDGKLLLLAAQDGSIRIFETRGYNEVSAFQAHAGGANCLLPIPGKPGTILSGGKDGHLRVWKEEREILAIPAHNFGIYRIIFLNGGKHFVTASRDKTIKLWDAQNFKVLERIERKHGGHSHAVNDLCKIDEFTFVSVGDDKRIISWDFKPPVDMTT